MAKRFVILCTCLLLTRAAAAQSVEQEAAAPQAASTDRASAAKGKQTARSAKAKKPAPIPALPQAPQAGDDTSPASGEPSASGDEITLEAWDQDDWMLLKPKLSLVDLTGYFRLRGDMLRKLDFDNATQTEANPRYVAASDGEAAYLSTNMRLRIEPRINVTDQIQIVTTFDILDNIVLGQTPNVHIDDAAEASTPVNVLSRSQRAPVRGDNALSDSIVVKRVYARMTALNEQLDLRFGRMPDHFGLGMLMNSGDCLDCNYGHTVDRIALTFRAADHLFSPMFDWVSSGPIATPFGTEGGQPLDAVRWDDAEQYTARIQRDDHPRDILEAVLQGDTVVNYGLHNGFRRQKRDLPANYYTNEGGAAYEPGKRINPETHAAESRDAFIYTGDVYAKIYSGNFELALEVAVEYGSFKDKKADSSVDPQKTDILTLGGCMEATYRFDGEYAGTFLSLKAGGASGDSRAHYGTLDQSDSQRGPGGTESDLNLHNLQFSPDYHVDLLMFRHIIGTVSDAWYVRPEVAYMFDEKVQGSLAAIYSQAITKRTTPGRDRPMGLEFDAELSYGLATEDDDSPFKAALMGGILFPFGAFKNTTIPEDEDQSPSFAWTIQARMYITF